jgi:FtsP/CotA-like multicopper oxidase with cupredoxin domain
VPQSRGTSAAEGRHSHKGQSGPGQALGISPILGHEQAIAGTGCLGCPCDQEGDHAALLVVPSQPDYWPPVDRELVLTLDDLLLEDGKVAPFSPTETTYAAMGRFGNVFLAGGDPDLRLAAGAGEVVRLWLTNTANTRVFNLRLPGARMKLVGGDSGRVEHQELVTEVLLAPSERAVVDVLVERPGELHLEHRTPDRTYPLAAITVGEEAGGAVAGADVRAAAPGS